MSLKQKSIKGIAWSFTETVGVKIFSVSVYFMLAKLLGPEPFGLVALTSSFIFVSSMVVDQGFVEALIQRKDLDNGVLSSAFWGITFLGISFFVILFFSAPFISDIYKEPQIIDLLRVHSFNFIVSSTGSVHRALLERDFNFRVIAIGRIVGIVLGGLVSILMAFYGYGAWCLVIQHMLFSVIQTIIFWLNSNWIPRIYFSWNTYKSLFSFGFKIVVTRILSNFNQYLYNLIIGYYFSASALGYFSFALKVFNTTNDLIITSTNKVLLPLFSGLQDDKKKLREAFFRSSYYMLIASLPLFCAMIVVIPDLIEMLYGIEWEPSKKVVQILALSGVSVLLIRIYQSLLIGAGKPEQNIAIDGLNLLVGAVSLLMLFDFGVEGAAWSFVIKYTITLSFVMWQLHNYLTVTKAFIISLVKPLLMFLFITVFILAVNYNFLHELSYRIAVSSILLFSFSLIATYISMPHLLTLKHKLYHKA